MGLGHERFNEALQAWTSDFRMSESNHRQFYRRWVAADDHRQLGRALSLPVVPHPTDHRGLRNVGINQVVQTIRTGLSRAARQGADLLDGGDPHLERCGNGRIHLPCVRLEQKMGPGELPSRAPALLGQSPQVRPCGLAPCHERSLGHQSRPCVLQPTPGRTVYQNRGRGPLVKQ